MATIVGLVGVSILLYIANIVSVFICTSIINEMFLKDFKGKTAASAKFKILFIITSLVPGLTLVIAGILFIITSLVMGFSLLFELSTDATSGIRSTWHQAFPKKEKPVKVVIPSAKVISE